MTEIKYRGPLTNNQREALVKSLKQKGKLLESTHEKVIFFDTSIFPQIGDFITGFSRVSIKADRHGAVLRIKEGNPSESERNEIAVAVKKKDLGNLVYLLNCLGLKNGYYRPVFREKFFLENIAISIKTNCVMGDHFEIELTNGTAITDPMVIHLLKKCSLAFWTKRQYQQRIKYMMKKFPAVNVSESNIWES
jgi:adenylate cyclase class IV